MQLVPHNSVVVKKPVAGSVVTKSSVTLMEDVRLARRTSPDGLDADIINYIKRKEDRQRRDRRPQPTVEDINDDLGREWQRKQDQEQPPPRSDRGVAIFQL
ncbi:MAG: hypothetical protein Q7S22_01525 [Candidatus Micrarchaeota archaeon]|nr:hypothetical protein [Candidatus Micrarchaeota archaeon]